MNWKPKTFLVLHFLITYCQANRYTYEDVTNYSIQYIRKNLNVNQVILVKLPQEFSSVQTALIQQFSSTFPSLIVSINELSNARNDKKLLKLTNLLTTKSENGNLNVMLISRERGRNITQELSQFIKFNIDYTNAQTKSIIFLFNADKGIDLYEFLKVMWSHKFLDITIIELLEYANLCDQLHPLHTLYDVLVHQYNPFNNVYRKEILSTQNPMFPDKLKDVYGYTLYTGFYDNSPLIWTKGNYSKFSRSVFGLESRITQALSKSINFSIGVNRS